MNRKREAVFMGIGVLAGLALSGPAAHAATSITATLSSQPIYVDGQLVSMAAYSIGGNNYVRLRDIGRTVDFGVTYDPATNSVYIDSTQPYQEKTAPTTPGIVTEESVQAVLAGLRERYPHGTVYPTPYRSTSNGPYSRGTYCSGWATLCSDAAFGDLPWRRVDSPSWEQIRPGDLVRYDTETSGHVMVVVKKTDDLLYFTDSGLSNKVYWEENVPRWWMESRSEYTLYDDKGLPVTKNVLAKTKNECVDKLKKLRESIETPSLEQPKPSILLGDWLDFWYQSYKKPNLRPNTQMSYERRIYQHIIPALGNTQLDRLTTADIQHFYAELKQNGRLLRTELYVEGLSDQTVRGIHTTLHAALNKAVSEKLLFRNPADACCLPPTKAREMQVLTPEEIQRLLIQAKEDGCFELLLLELSTGLRRGEICALQWDDLNFRTGELRVERQVHRVNGKLVVSPPKTKAANRSVIFPAPVLGVLKVYRETGASQWMFPSPTIEDSPRDPAAVRKRLQTVLERAECKKIRFHNLRHTFCAASLEHGIDIKTLSTIIGHVSSSTTLDIYAHVTNEMRRTAAVKIDQGIGKADPQAEAEATPRKPTPSSFQAHKGQWRKAGTGCVTQINEKLWEGRYSPVWPDGKKHPRNVYAHSEEECEKLLAEMISQMKAEINVEKARLNAG